MKKLAFFVSRVISVLFHPLLIPTWGLLLLGNSGFYFSQLPWSVQKYIFLVVFISTCLLPALSIGIISYNNKLKEVPQKTTDRILFLLISSISYYIGYLVLEKMPVFPVYNLFLIAFILVQIALIVCSLRWNVSNHTAAIGALIGGFIAISSRMHENPLLMLAIMIFFAGVIGSSRLILLKNTHAEVYAGFLIGFIILNLVVTFI